MTSRLLVLGLALLLAGCGSENDPPATGGTDEVQLVGDQAVCDSCTSVRIVVAGPGIASVTEAALVTSGTVRTPVPARIVLARESRESGEVLVVNAYFDAGISEGEFDLWLDPVSADDGARIVPRALLVTRGRAGSGDLAVVRVWVQLSGVDLDGRFALRTVAGCQSGTCAPAPVEAYAATALQVPPGDYTFQLDDVANNCTIIGGTPNPSTVTLQRARVTALSYQVTCTQTTTPGWIRVTNRTTGIDLDENYQVTCSLYTCRPFTLAANRDTVLRVVPGAHTVRLIDVASHCTLAGASSLDVTAAAGDTADAGFSVDCAGLPGIRTTIRTTGRDIDPAFQLTVCQSWLGYYGSCFARSTESNSVVTFSRLESGNYNLFLYDMAENCALAPSSPTNVQVGSSTVDITLDVTCLALGTVRVSAVTTGPNADLSYVVVRPAGCDGWYYYCDSRALPASGSVDFRVAPGSQSFELRDVAPNCAVIAPSNPATVTATEDGVVELRFEVTCQ